LDNFKNYLLSTLGSQIDTLKDKNKQEYQFFVLDVGKNIHQEIVLWIVFKFVAFV